MRPVDLDKFFDSANRINHFTDRLEYMSKGLLIIDPDSHLGNCLSDWAKEIKQKVAIMTGEFSYLNKNRNA